MLATSLGAAHPATASQVTVLEAEALAEQPDAAEVRLVVDVAETASLPAGSKVFDDPILEGVGKAVVDVPAHAAGEVDGEAPAPMSAAVTPDDPHFRDGKQTALHDLRAPRAWERATGRDDVVVAVLDSGVWPSHADLNGKLWRNANENCGDGDDDDGNGIADDCAGWDFVNEDADPSDDDGHGTLVAGQIAAATDNGTGGSGICWGCQVMAVKVLDNEGNGSSLTVARGMLYAIEQGADVINLSLGGDRLTSDLREALAEADREGVLVVAAAGNRSRSAPHYPAAHPTVLAVGATRAGAVDRLEYYSNHGDWVDVAAPGEAYNTTVFPRSGAATYAWEQGTSMASPLVAGGAALVLSLDHSLDDDTLHASAVASARQATTPAIGGGFLDLADWLDEAVDRRRIPAQAARLVDDRVASDGGPVSVEVLANDRAPRGHDFDQATLQVTEHPGRGQAEVTGAAVRYRPAPGFTGEDRFRYRVCTHAGACASARVTVDITSPAPAPPPPGGGSPSDGGDGSAPGSDPPAPGGGQSGSGGDQPEPGGGSGGAPTPPSDEREGSGGPVPAPRPDFEPAPTSDDAAIQRVCPNGDVPAAAFRDVAGPHAGAVHCLVWHGVASGRSATEFAPARTVTREQMATFLVNLLTSVGVDLPSGSSPFRDLGASVHAPAVERLAVAGLVKGTGADRFSPRRAVTRDQMASFLVAALEHAGAQLPPPDDGAFTDTAGSVHEAAIDKVAAAGVSRGYGDGTYRPRLAVTRAQMASFLARGLDHLAGEGVAAAQVR